MDTVDGLDADFNVFLGSGLGVLKGVYFGPETPRLKNFHTFEGPENSEQITHLSWVDEDEQTELLVAYSNHVIKIYNRKLHAFTQGIQLDLTKGPIVGIHNYESNYLVGVESGNAVLWNFEEDRNIIEIKTGEHLSKLRQCPSNKSIFATGGKENDLKIWDVQAPDPSVPIFKARNVPHDNLDLRVPVWVQDITFMPNCQDLVSICSRYGHVRLYDTNVNDKCRPVVNMKFVNHPLMAISSTRNDRQVLVGSSQGKMGLIDLRNVKMPLVVRTYVGSTGGIRCINAHADEPYFVSCGLDRHLYIHHLEQKHSVKKLYLKSSLNCVLMANNFRLDDTSVWQNINMKTLPTYEKPHNSPSPRKKIKRAEAEKVQI